MENPEVAPIGTIWITLDGASEKNTERCREIIHLMFERGIFNIRNGSVELHFDNEGTIQIIKTHAEVFKRNRVAAPLQNIYKRVSIRSLDPAMALNLDRKVMQEHTI